MLGKVGIVMLVLVITIIIIDFVLIFYHVPRQERRRKKSGHVISDTPPNLNGDFFQVGFFKTTLGNVLASVFVDQNVKVNESLKVYELGIPTLQPTDRFSNQGYTSYFGTQTGTLAAQPIQPIGMTYHPDPTLQFLLYGPTGLGSYTDYPQFDIFQQGDGSWCAPNIAPFYRTLPQGTGSGTPYCTVTKPGPPFQWALITNTRDTQTAKNNNNVIACLPVGTLSVDTYPTPIAYRQGTLTAKAGFIAIANIGVDCQLYPTKGELGVYVWMWDTSGWPASGAVPVNPASGKCTSTSCPSGKICNTQGACQCPGQSSLCTDTPIPFTFSKVPNFFPTKSEIHGQYIYVWGYNNAAGQGMTVVRLLVSTPNSVDSTTTITQDMSFMGGNGYFSTDDNAGGIMVNPIDPTKITMLHVPQGTLKGYVSLGKYETTPSSQTVYNYSPFDITVNSTAVKSGLTETYTRNSGHTLAVNGFTVPESLASNGGLGTVITQAKPPIYLLLNGTQLFVLGAAALLTDQNNSAGFIPPSLAGEPEALIGYMAPSHIVWNGGGFSIFGKAPPSTIPSDQPLPSTVATAPYTYLCWNPELTPEENNRIPGSINALNVEDMSPLCILMNSRGQSPGAYEGRIGATIASGYQKENLKNRTLFPIPICNSMSEKPVYTNNRYNTTPKLPCKEPFITFEGVHVPFTADTPSACLPTLPITDSMGNVLPCTIEKETGIINCTSPDGSKTCTLENGQEDFSCGITGYPSVRKNCSKPQPYKTIDGFTIPYGTGGANCYPSNPGGGIIPVIGPDGTVISPECTKTDNDTSITCNDMKISVGESGFTVQPN